MFISFLLSLVFARNVLALWPVPTHYTNGTSVVWISEDTDFRYMTPNLTPTAQYTNRSMNGSLSQKVVESAIDRTINWLFGASIVPWKFHPRNSDFAPPVNATKTYIKQVEIWQTRADPGNLLKPLAGQFDESYNLSITTDGKANITAFTSIGCLRALETFTQLFYQHPKIEGGIYTPVAPVHIEDRPVFSHRGLNLDISRNFYEIADILRTIDALSWNKFNRLHLHATDAQSWPLDIPSMPNLSALGAYMTGYSYTPDDLAYIQEFGAYRGVEVIIETDMPGHTASIAWSYPELIAAYNRQPDWVTYSAEPPTGQLKLNSSAVYDFLSKLWQDLLPRVGSYSGYFHTGGDELNANVYLLDETVRSNDSKVLTPLLQKFVDFNHDAVRKAGMTPIVWEEMLLQWNLKLGSDVVVQTWVNDSSAALAVAKGHKVIAGNVDSWYLDCGRGQWIDFPPGPLSTSAYPYTDYCSPYKNWRAVYAYDPLTNIPANSSHLVLGGEVHLWSEQTDPVNLDDMLWPRAAAAAEVLWSGAKDAEGRNRSQLLASPRLGEMRERMVERGVRGGPVQMVYCTQNGTQCVAP